MEPWKGRYRDKLVSADHALNVIQPRHSVCFGMVATEYGVVNPLGRSRRERAEWLISMAHPSFQDRLRQEAKTLFWP